MHKIIVLAGVTAALAFMAAMSSRADDMYPNSFVNAHANASSIRTSNYYYNYYGYYDDYSSNSADGSGGGAAFRVVLPGGFMFDATYNTDKSNAGDGSIRINQGTAGLGYLGNLRRGPTWYVEVMYATFRPSVDSNYLCGGSCGSVTYNGAGLKGGFMWPFAGRWYSTLDVGVAGLHGPSGTDSIVQGILGGSIGYKFTPNFGVNVGILSNAWIDGNSNGSGYDTTISVSSLQAGLSLHF